MGRQTKIEYCDSTVNPVIGCTGCRLYHPDPAKNHCYAASLCKRWGSKPGWPDDFTEPIYVPERLNKALAWPDLTGQERPDKPWLNGYPRLIFVNDLGDGFCPDVDPEAWLKPYIERMAESPHIWLMLTKWPNGMFEFFDRLRVWPRNFWFGISALSGEDIQKVVRLADWKAILSERGADIKIWISYEPALGPLGLSDLDRTDRFFLSLVDLWVAGGESGFNARPAHPDWFRELRDTTRSWGSRFFLKQWGAWKPTFRQSPIGIPVETAAFELNAQKLVFGDGQHVDRVGKKRAGRHLDGREWNEMPEIAPCQE